MVEMNPGLTLLGATLVEATQMLSTHEQVLEKIHVSDFMLHILLMLLSYLGIRIKVFLYMCVRVCVGVTVIAETKCLDRF